LAIAETLHRAAQVLADRLADEWREARAVKVRVHWRLRLPFPTMKRLCLLLVAALGASMQGPSELGASGKLERWDRSKDLSKLAMPTLVIGARYDTARHCRNRICRAVVQATLSRW